jgi:hypothetical protein
VEASIFNGYVKTGKTVTANYESFIGVGTAERISGTEALMAMDLMLEHCGVAEVGYPRERLDEITAIFKIEVESYAAKRSDFSSVE